MTTLVEARAFPAEGEPITVPQAFQDVNGHMNIRHYFDLASKVIEQRFEAYGVTDDYRAGGQGFFTVENNAKYHAECHVGDRLVIHVHGERLSDKAVRTTVFIVNDTTDRLACTFTSVAVHVDLGSRRSAPMGPVLLDRVRALTGG